MSNNLKGPPPLPKCISVITSGGPWGGVELRRRRSEEEMGENQEEGSRSFGEFEDELEVKQLPENPVPDQF